MLCGLSAGSLCWFERGDDRLPRRVAARSQGIGLLPGSNAVHYDKEPHRRPAYHAAVARRDAAAATRPRTARRCTSSATDARARGRPRGRRRAPTASTRVDGEVVELPLAGRLPGRGATPRSRRLPPEPGARRAGRVPTIFAMGGGGFTMEPEQPGARRLRALARAGARAADLPAADRRRRLRGPDPPLPRRVRRPALRADARLAVPARRRTRCRCASTCSRRTSSTSAAARWSTCSRSGARTGSTRSCARRGRPGSCSPG